MRVRENIFKSYELVGRIKTISPVLAKDRVIQDNLLQELDQLIGKVGSHESLDCDGHFFWILSLRQGCLDHLERGTKHSLAAIKEIG